MSDTKPMHTIPPADHGAANPYLPAEIDYMTSEELTFDALSEVERTFQRMSFQELKIRQLMIAREFTRRKLARAINAARNDPSQLAASLEAFEEDQSGPGGAA